MRLMARFGLFLAMLLLAATYVLGQTTMRARTESGKEVILSSDGTWKYAAVVIMDPPLAPPVRRGVTNISKTLFKSPLGGFGIWYDQTKWLMRPGDDRGRTSFKLKRGDAYALLIVEEIGIPLSTLREIALENAKEAAPDSRIVFEESRTINGKEVLVMKIDGTVKEIPFRYYGYYYGSKTGTVQLLTYTAQSLFDKYEQDFIEFLNGFEIY